MPISRATLELDIPGVGAIRLPWNWVTMDPEHSGGVQLEVRRVRETL